MERTYSLYFIYTVLAVTGLTPSLLEPRALYSLYFQEEFRLTDVISFVNSDRSCGFNLDNLPSLILQDTSKSVGFKETCVLLATCTFDHPPLNETQFIDRVNVTFIAERVKYNFDVKPHSCYERQRLKKVDLFLSCQRITGSNGKICANGRGCNSAKEYCNKVLEDNNRTGICMARRDVYESCDTNLQCKPTTECKHIGGKRVCYCPKRSELINGTCLQVGLSLNESCSYDLQCTGTVNAGTCQQQKHYPGRVCSCNSGFLQEGEACLKDNRRLFESCESHRQCTGTHGARECKITAGSRMCHCPDNRRVFQSVCVKAGLDIGDPCLISEECTGTKNGGRCIDNNGGRRCSCNEGFLRNGSFCLSVNKTLFETCEVDDQCNGTLGLGICKAVGNRKVCVCGPEYIEDKETFKCQKVGKRIFETCMLDDQCAGTMNAAVCRYQEKAQNRVCVCSDGFEWVNDSCVPTSRQLLESCDFDVQCNGTQNATICRMFGNRSLCFCDEGMLEFDGKCIEVGKHLDDPCEMDRQCTGTQHAGVCGDNSWCSCDRGFIKENSECVKDGWLREIMYKFLLVGTGGFMVGIIYIIVILLKKLRRYLPTRTGRLPIQTHRNQTVETAIEEMYDHESYACVAPNNEPKTSVQKDECGASKHKRNPFYDTVEDDENPSSQQMTPFIEQNSSDDMYNHLHEKDTPLCHHNMYDVVETISDHGLQNSNREPESSGFYDFAEPINNGIS